MLLDRIFAEGGKYRFCDIDMDELSQGVPVNIDNVASYYMEVSDQQHWSLLEDFPNVAPPWPNVWLEYQPPRNINIKGQELTNNPLRQAMTRIGVHLMYQDAREIIRERIENTSLEEQLLAVATAKISEQFFKEGIGEGKVEELFHGVKQNASLILQQYPGIVDMLARSRNYAYDIVKERGVKWEVVAHFFFQLRNKKVTSMFPCTLSFFVSDQGKISAGMFEDNNPDAGPYLVSYFDQSILSKDGLPKEVAHKHFTDFADQLLKPGLLAICFAHCKNVSIRQEKIDERAAKLRTQRKQRPFVRYSVLDIDPMKKVIRNEGRLAESGIKKALHIVRGHFAHYGEDNPLFGKHKNVTVWKSMHVRGSSDEGIVKKQYKIGAP